MNRIEHKDDNQLFKYVEYSPETGSENKPLIIQLHGAGERGNGKEELRKVDVHGFSKLLENTEYDCTFIMPQCPSDSFWAARVESIVKFIEQKIEEYKADPDRIYLTGLSMGGYGTWFTSMARPDLFAAIAPVCGGGMAWNACALKAIPVWAFHGVVDDTVSVNQSDEMVAALKACGAPVRYSRIEDVAHNVWDYAYNEELMEWLLEHKRKVLCCK